MSTPGGEIGVKRTKLAPFGWDNIFWSSAMGEGTFAFFLTLFMGTARMMLCHFRQDRDCLNAGVIEFALTAGLIVYALCCAFGRFRTTGGNPAITLAYVITQRITILHGLIHLAMQLAGAVVAGFFLKYLLGWFEPLLGVPVPLPSLTRDHLFVFESLATFLITLVVLLCSDCAVNCKSYAAVIAATTFFTYYFTGASLNAMSHFGLAAASGHWDLYWVYLLAFVVGSLVATVFYAVFFLKMKRALDAQDGGNYKASPM